MAASEGARNTRRYWSVALAVVAVGAIVALLVFQHARLSEYRAAAAAFRDVEHATAIESQSANGGPLTSKKLTLTYSTEDAAALEAEVTDLLIANGWTPWEVDDGSWRSPDFDFPAYFSVWDASESRAGGGVLQFGIDEG